MKSLLIADDADDKVKFLARCVQRSGPSELHGLPLLIARTTEQAVQLITDHQELGAGFVDFQIPRKNGPYIIQTWRRIEQETQRTRSYICMQTRAYDEEFLGNAKLALDAGADDACQLVYANDKNPVDAVLEILEKMRPFLLRT